MPPESLLAHPLERLALGPVAAKADLHEVSTCDPPLLEQAAHRGTVRQQRTPDLVAGVGVRVEVHDADPARMHVSGDRGSGRIGDRVVSTEHDRDCAGARNSKHLLVDDAVRPLESRRNDWGVARVDDDELAERFDLELDRPRFGRSPVVRRLADRPRSEPSPGPSGCPVVERRADDRYLRSCLTDRVLVGRPRQLVERTAPVGVVRQILPAELVELVTFGLELTLLDAEVARVGHCSGTLPVTHAARPRTAHPR